MPHAPTPLTNLKKERETLRIEIASYREPTNWRAISDAEHRIKHLNEAIAVLEAWEKVKPYVNRSLS